jgi:hypothetical protein
MALLVGTCAQAPGGRAVDPVVGLPAMQGLETLPRPRITVWRALWHDLPLLNYAFYAVAIAFAEVVNLNPRRDDLFLSFLFALAVPVLVYGMRWRHAGSAQKRAALGVVLVSLVLLALAFFVVEPYPLDTARLRWFYEIGAILNTIVLMAHAYKHHPAWLVLFLGPVALYGVMLENGGIVLGYFEELEYTLYLGPLPAPVATMSGWITVYYLVTWVTWQLQEAIPALGRTVAGSAAIAMTAALCLDLQIDPLATAVGFWTWNHQLPNSGIMGVPVLNFVAWASAVFSFGLFLFWRQIRLGLDPKQVADKVHCTWLLVRVPAILVVAALLFWSLMTLLELGVDGPTWQILRSTFIGWGWIQPDLS